MALTKAAIKASIAWEMEKTNTPFAKTKQGQDSVAFSAAPAIATFGQALVTRYSISSGGTQTIDLYGGFTNLVGESTGNLTKVCGIILKPSGTGSTCKIEPGASNALTWFFSGTTPAISIPAGGIFLFYQPTAQVLSSTVRNLKVTAVSADLTLDVAFILGA